MSADLPKVMRNRRADSRLSQVLDVATHLINRYGVSESLLADVATAVGISRASLYHYVRDRADLVFLVCDRTLCSMSAALHAVDRPGQSAIMIVQDFVSAILAPDAEEICTMAETGLLDSIQIEQIQAMESAFIAYLRSILSSGIERGELRNFDPDNVARTVASLVRSVPFVTGWAKAASSYDLDRVGMIDSLNDLLEWGWASDRRQQIDCPPINLAALIPPAANAFDKAALSRAKTSEIIRVACALFNRRGIDSTPIDEIANQLRTNKPTIYRLIGNKQAVLTACYARTAEINRHILREALGRGGSRSDALVTILRTIAIAQQSDQVEPLRPQVGYHSLSPEMQEKLGEQDRRMTSVFLDLLQAMASEDQLRNVDHIYLRATLLGGNAWLARLGPAMNGLKRTAFAAEVVDVLRLGLSAI